MRLSCCDENKRLSNKCCGCPTKLRLLEILPPKEKILVITTAPHLTPLVVAPQKKYYYLIRTLTNFGIHSNPTRIYEVEVIQDSDETYLVYDEFKFETVNNPTGTKLFKNSMKYDIKLSLGIIEKKSNAVIE